jgi:hypothetical protein
VRRRAAHAAEMDAAPALSSSTRGGLFQSMCAGRFGVLLLLAAGGAR